MRKALAIVATTVTFFSVLVLVLVAGAPSATAQQPNPAFDQAYNEGVDAFNLGRYDQAKEKFARARDLAPNLPGPWRWLGAVARAQGDWVECVRASSEAIRRHPTSSQAPKVRAHIEQCRAQLKRPPAPELPPSQGGVVVITNVEGATVSIDDVLKGGTPLPPIPVKPGKRIVKVAKKGWIPEEVEVDVIPTIVVDVEVPLQKDPTYRETDVLDESRKAIENVGVGWIVVDANVPRPRVAVDGKVATPETDGSYAVTPGIHVFEVTAPEHEPWRRRVLVGRGQKRTVRPELRRSDARAAQRRNGTLALSVAVAFGALGAATGIVENRHFDEAQRIYLLERDRPLGANVPGELPEGDVRTREELEREVARGRRMAIISNVSYGLAVAGLGTAIYYFVNERSVESRGYPLPFAVAPVVDPEARGGALVFTMELSP